MPASNRIDMTPIRLNTQLAEERQTPKTDFGSKLKDGMQTTAHVAGTVASYLPGGAILSAAVSAGSSLVSTAASSTSGGSGVTGTTGSTPSAGGTNTSSVGPVGGSAYQDAMNLLTSQEQMNMRYLGLQQSLQNESIKYTALSNIMKTRHDTSKNTLANVR